MTTIDEDLEFYHNGANEIRELYPKLKKHSDIWVYGLYESICEDQMLTEFITKTIDIDKTIKMLNSRFDNIDTRFDNNVIFLKFEQKNYNTIAKINKAMDAFGWYPAWLGNTKFSDENLTTAMNKFNIFIIKYEAKYDAKVKLKSKYLYHLTPDIIYKKISINGLTPKTKSRLSAYPERIYLLNKATEDEYEEVALELWSKLVPETKNLIKNYFLLRIDTSKLQNFNFYKDPSFKMANGGVWVYQNIPAAHIKYIGSILVNPPSFHE